MATNGREPNVVTDTFMTIAVWRRVAAEIVATIKDVQTRAADRLDGLERRIAALEDRPRRGGKA
jgi:hypothetical protein